MDNRIFNVNGRSKEQLKLAIDLLLLDEYNGFQKVKGWYYDVNKSFVLTWHVHNKSTAFTDRLGKPSEIKSNELTEILWDWLDSDEAKDVIHTSWDCDVDHDGDNDLGWRLYTEDWGKVNNDSYSIAAFKPAWLWYGK